jgi:multidrug efflux system membrane fusion protein
MSEPQPGLTPEQRQMLQGGGRSRTGCWIVVVIVLLLAVAGGAAWWFRAAWLPADPAAAKAGGPPDAPGAGGGKRGGGRQNGPTPVVVAPVARRDVDITLDALGTVTPLATVTVRTQISGVLTQVAFAEGQQVLSGDFLAQIDARPYQLALDQYQGQVQRDEALLTQAKADLARYQTLAEQDSIARQQVDAATALVGQYQGALAVDQAQIGTAKLNLAYCHIVAPVSGRVGMRQVDAGNYITPGDSAGIVVITQTTPMSVIFNLPEDSLPAVLKRFRSGATLAVTAFDRSGSVRLADGTLAAVDNQIDSATGTVRLRARFDNPDDALFAGQFVNARLLVDTLPNALVVPSSAIQRGTPGTYVYVVGDAGSSTAAAASGGGWGRPASSAAIDPGGAGSAPAAGSATAPTVAVRVVTLGPVSGDDVTVTSGLVAGERVVIDGADKLKDGAQVTPSGRDGAGHGGRHGRRDGSATAAATATGAAPADAGTSAWPGPGASATGPDGAHPGGAWGATDAAADGGADAHPHRHHRHGATAADAGAGATTAAPAGDGTGPVAP